MQIFREALCFMLTDAVNLRQGGNMQRLADRQTVDALHLATKHARIMPEKASNMCSVLTPSGRCRAAISNRVSPERTR
ncbi:MAG: hypothetical protein R3E95_18800 [Thiolinea sp.]